MLGIGYDALTGLACSAMNDILFFSISPTNVHTLGIFHEITELFMFSGFLVHLIVLIIFDIIIAYVLGYARKVKKDKMPF